MLIQWCLKGVSYDAKVRNSNWAKAVLGGDAITSAWLRHAVNDGIPSFPSAAESRLSSAALDDHVHAYDQVETSTPYISLSAGCVERVAQGVTVHHSALRTALAFATGDGTTYGWVFLCWVHVAPKPAAELPGMAEEIRDLNLFSAYSVFHEEGEVAAKLFVPSRQIRSATLYRNDLTFSRRFANPEFVPPDRVSNIIGLV